MHLCTIVAKNYLPQARVLASSARAVHADARITVLVVDDLDCEVDDSQEPFEVLRVSDLEGDLAELHRMAVIYSVLEYSTALKPWLLRTLLSRGASTVAYLDPDIQVFDSLDEVDELSRRHDVVLTPHVTSPMPRDGKNISESDVLAAGIYNLGFVAVSGRSHDLLDYWSERLKRECVVDPQGMRFVDQRWVDFAPGIYDVWVLREPGYNVAYWNLDHRALRWTGHRYEVTGEPLHFFHFSGYSPRAPHLLSKHQAQPPRILLSERPVVRRICGAYRDQLVANGYFEVSPTYGLERMANGLPIDHAVRRLYRDAVLKADAGDRPYPEDPFTIRGADVLLAWMNGTAEVDAGPARLTRYLASVYASRGDLQAAYPDPQGANFDGFIAWARNEVASGRLDARLIPPEGHDIADIRGTRSLEFAPSDELSPGFTVIGYLRAELGVGEWGRLATRAIETGGLRHATVTTTKTTSRQQHPFEESKATRYGFDTNLLCVNADQVPFTYAELGPECFAGRHTIGQWAWELEEFPDRWSASFDLVDEVWAISQFTQGALSAATTKPVYAVPPAIVEPGVPEGRDRSSLGLPEGRFMFLFAFDLLSVIERKNPLGSLAAFCRAFPHPRPDGPVLVLKVINGDQRVADLERIRFAALERPDVVVVDRYFDASDQAALMAACDCYVSLHRSEGFGLTMAEAMALGKPVVATGYSGNMEFMNAENAYLVRWDYGRVPAGCDPYRIGARWAEPDLDHAAELLRSVYESPTESGKVGERARQTVLANHGLEARSILIKDRFAAIQAMRAAKMAESAARGSDGDRTLRRLATARPSLDIPAKRFPRLTRLYRRGVLRTQRHHDEHQRRVNAALVDEFDEVRREVEEARVRTAESIRQLSDLRGMVGRLEFAEMALVDASKTFAGHEETMRALERGLENLESGSISDMMEMGAGLQEQIVRVHEENARLQAQIERVGCAVDELRSIPFMVDREELLILDESGRPAIGYRSASGESQEASYAKFEDVFRGSEEMIRGRQEIYVPMLREKSPIVDVGCGRGEMLDLLASEGLSAIGVDPDASMVERCKRKGHKVELADADSFFAGCSQSSFGAVFSAQVIEHLSYEALVRLLSESYRVLEDGGVFIAETVNPHSVPAFKTFWTDLTHRVPIFPEVAVTLCRTAGFADAIVVFPNGSGELDMDRWRIGEYAVVATKRES